MCISSFKSDSFSSIQIYWFEMVFGSPYSFISLLRRAQRAPMLSRLLAMSRSYIETIFLAEPNLQVDLSKTEKKLTRNLIFYGTKVLMSFQRV